MNNLLLDFEKEIINENIPIQNIPIIPLKEINYTYPLCVNNHQILQNISLDEIKKIIEGPKLDINEDNVDDRDDSIYFIKNQNISNIDLQSTDNSTKNISLQFYNIINGKKEDYFNKKINFKIILHHKRGRKGKENKNNKKYKKCHGSDDFDNIQRKIQVHFINFLIKLANDIIKSIFGKKSKLHFKTIKYELKKIVNHKYIENLKQCNYSDIIQMKVSPKNRNFGEDTNKNSYILACQNSEEIKKIFDKNYLYIFQKYYYSLKKNEKKIDLDGININLSPKTKGFYNLLGKNEVNKDKFFDVVKNVYFKDKNYLIEKKFITKNCNELRE